MPEAATSPDLDDRTLREFSWSGLVKQHFFESTLIGAVGAVAGSLSFPAAGTPSWLLVSTPVTIICIVLAFVRIWKTIREEHETADKWTAVEQGNDEEQAILDRIVEIPYLFGITFLPLAAAAPQAFMVVLIVFYLADNYYNAELARRQAKMADAPGRTYVRACLTAFGRACWLRMPRQPNSMANYFRSRSRYDTWIIATVTVTFVVVSALTIIGEGGVAAVVCGLVLGAITFFEVVLEPRRNRGMEFVPDKDSPG